VFLKKGKNISTDFVNVGEEGGGKRKGVTRTGTAGERRPKGRRRAFFSGVLERNRFGHTGTKEGEKRHTNFTSW